MRDSTLASMDIANLDLNVLNCKFEKADPRKIMTWCVGNFTTGLVQTSTFNIDDLVITDLLYRYLQPDPPIPVVFVDTLHHFTQTLELVERAKAIYNLDLRSYQISGLNSRKAFEAKYGAALWERDRQQFDYLTKIGPLQRGLTELKAMVTITGNPPKDQRKSVFERDRQGRLQVNPLAFWSRTESWAYAYEYDLIYNPLHDEGYGNIGDEPLTLKITVGEKDKYWRLWGMLKTECGIYSI